MCEKSFDVLPFTALACGLSRELLPRRTPSLNELTVCCPVTLPRSDG